MSAREKPAPLVWERVTGSAKRAQIAYAGNMEIVVWHVGGEFPWRSQIEDGRTVSHFGEDSAKASAEKRLRKAGA